MTVYEQCRLITRTYIQTYTNYTHVMHLFKPLMIQISLNLFLNCAASGASCSH